MLLFTNRRSLHGLVVTGPAAHQCDSTGNLCSSSQQKRTLVPFTADCRQHTTKLWKHAKQTLLNLLTDAALHYTAKTTKVNAHNSK